MNIPFLVLGYEFKRQKLNDGSGTCPNIRILRIEAKLCVAGDKYRKKFKGPIEAQSEVGLCPLGFLSLGYAYRAYSFSFKTHFGRYATH